MFTALVSTRTPFRPRNARATCVVVVPPSARWFRRPLSALPPSFRSVVSHVETDSPFRERGIETERLIGLASQHGTTVCAMHEALPLQPRKVAANTGR